MKLFQNVRSNFEKMGIDSYQTNQVQSFNGKVPLILLCLVIMFISTTAAVVLKATAIFEYAICFYFNATRSTVMAIYLIYLFKMSKITKFIENSERFIEKSEWYLDK